MSFQLLPNETLFQIIQSLTSVQDVLSLSLTSRRLHDLISRPAVSHFPLLLLTTGRSFADSPRPFSNVFPSSSRPPNTSLAPSPRPSPSVPTMPPSRLTSLVLLHHSLSPFSANSSTSAPSPTRGQTFTLRPTGLVLPKEAPRAASLHHPNATVSAAPATASGCTVLLTTTLHTPAIRAANQRP